MGSSSSRQEPEARLTNPLTDATFLSSAHTNLVRALIRIGDARFASASDDGTVMVWCGVSGARIGAWRAHDRPVTSLLAVDRVHLVSGSASGQIKMWNSYTGELLFERQAHAGSVKILALLPHALPAAQPAVPASPSAPPPRRQPLPARQRTSTSSASVTVATSHTAALPSRRQFVSVGNDADVCVWDCGGALVSAFHMSTAQENLQAALICSGHRLVVATDSPQLLVFSLLPPPPSRANSQSTSRIMSPAISRSTSTVSLAASTSAAPLLPVAGSGQLVFTSPLASPAPPPAGAAREFTTPSRAAAAAASTHTSPPPGAGNLAAALAALHASPSSASFASSVWNAAVASPVSTASYTSTVAAGTHTSLSSQSHVSFLDPAAPRVPRTHEQALRSSHRDSVQLLVRLSAHAFASASLDGPIVIWTDPSAASAAMISGSGGTFADDAIGSSSGNTAFNISASVSAASRLRIICVLNYHDVYMLNTPTQRRMLYPIGALLRIGAHMLVAAVGSAFCVFDVRNAAQAAGRTGNAIAATSSSTASSTSLGRLLLEVPNAHGSGISGSGGTSATAGATGTGGGDGDGAPISQLASLYGGRVLVTAAADATVRVWRLDQLFPPATMTPSPTAATKVSETTATGSSSGARAPSTSKTATATAQSPAQPVALVALGTVDAARLLVAELPAHDASVRWLLKLDEHAFVSCDTRPLMVLWKDGRLANETRSLLARQAARLQTHARAAAVSAHLYNATSAVQAANSAAHSTASDDSVSATDAQVLDAAFLLPPVAAAVYRVPSEVDANFSQPITHASSSSSSSSSRMRVAPTLVCACAQCAPLWCAACMVHQPLLAHAASSVVQASPSPRAAWCGAVMATAPESSPPPSGGGAAACADFDDQSQPSDGGDVDEQALHDTDPAFMSVTRVPDLLMRMGSTIGAGAAVRSRASSTERAADAGNAPPTSKTSTAAPSVAIAAASAAADVAAAAAEHAAALEQRAVMAASRAALSAASGGGYASASFDEALGVATRLRDREQMSVEEICFELRAGGYSDTTIATVSGRL